MPELAVLDVVIVITAAVSVLIGALRGLVREALSLLVWLGAVVVANLTARDASRLFENYVSDPDLRFPLAFAAVFLAALVLGSLITRLLGMLVHATGLTGLDRTLGTLFGAARAAVLLVVITAFAAPLFADTRWWQASRFVPSLVDAQEGTFALLDALAETVTAWMQGGISA